MIGIDISIIARIEKMVDRFGDKALRKFLKIRLDEYNKLKEHLK